MEDAESLLLREPVVAGVKAGDCRRRERELPRRSFGSWMGVGAGCGRLAAAAALPA